MDEIETAQQLVARCIVCRGDIVSSDAYEIWEDAFYCERHSLPHLRARAREYRELITRSEARDWSR